MAIYHIMLTIHPFDENGNWAAKSRKEYILDENGEKIRLPSGVFKSRKVNAVDWNDKTKAEDWRKAWAAYANGALRIAGALTEDNVLDHRSYERQGIEQIPTVHLGAAASQMERKSIATERGNINREIAVTNREIRQLRVRINKTLDWLKTEAANTAPPDIDRLRDVLQGCFDVKKLPPMTKWKEERAAKIAEQKALYADYYRLRDEVKNAEAIKRRVEQLVRVDEPKRELQQRKRSYEIGL